MMTDRISFPFAQVVDNDNKHMIPVAYMWPCGQQWEMSFQQTRSSIARSIKIAPRIQRGTWQTLDVSGSDKHITRELINTTVIYDIPNHYSTLVSEVKPDIPWAHDHFEERVSGQPLNPPPSHVNWPYHGSDKEQHIDGQVFSHTYPERFWPKYAGKPECNCYTPCEDETHGVNQGIRFEYGDLDDVVNQLVKNPYTRQAVLPVFFPEDTGAVANQRVPCTIAYHFMTDENMRLHCWYYIRACDFVRHFHNDVFFAARLTQWICHMVYASGHDWAFTPGNLNMTISSLHVFEGDLSKLPS